MRILIGPILLCVIAAPADAQDPEIARKLPIGRTPSPMLARLEEGALLVTVLEIRFVEEKYTVQIPVTRVVNGKNVTEFRASTRVRKRPVTEYKTLKLTQDDATVYDVAGQKVPHEDLSILLKAERLVLVTNDRKPLPPAFRTLYRDDVLVVVPQKPIAQPGPVPVPIQVRPAPPALRPAGARIPIRVRAVPIQLQIRAVPAQAKPAPRQKAPVKEAPPLPEGR
ncbi:MAG: hypothetical protein H8E37_12115 [Planctomycetes bacterium]|nr:hypothetical protein [Planctomycetota bacterium]